MDDNISGKEREKPSEDGGKAGPEAGFEQHLNTRKLKDPS